MRLAGPVLSVVLILGIAGALSGQQAPVKTDATKTAANPPDDKKAWPVAFGDSAAPATRADATRVIVAPVVTNASAAQQKVRASVVLRSAAGAPVRASVVCVLRSPQSKPGATGESGQRAVAAAPDHVLFPSCELTLPQQSGAVLLEATIDVRGVPRAAYPLNGMLVLQPVDKGSWTDEQPRATLALSAIPLESAAAIDWQIVSHAGVRALAVVVVAAIVCLFVVAPEVWLMRMGSATFSFSESWSSALMVGGPLLTTLVTTFAGFPDYPPSMSKKSYLFMSLLLSAVIAFGPAIFNLARVPTPITDATGKWTLQNQGYVLFFFLAAVVALTGGLAQLNLLRVLLRDLADVEVLSADLGSGLETACYVLFNVVLIASVFSLVMTVRAATKPERTAPADQGDLARAKVPSSASARLPEWSLP
jgi:hypothetical protein